MISLCSFCFSHPQHFAPPQSCQAMDDSKPLLAVHFILKLIFIGVQLLYNAVLVLLYSKVNQLYVHIYPLYATRFSWNALLPVISTPISLSSFTHCYLFNDSFPDALFKNYNNIPRVPYTLSLLYFSSRSLINIVFITYLLVLITLSSPSLR